MTRCSQAEHTQAGQDDCLVVLSPVEYHLQPQKANREEWEEVEEHVPVTQPWRNCLNVNRCLPAAIRTLHNDSHTPKLLGIQGHFGLILHMPP